MSSEVELKMYFPGNVRDFLSRGCSSFIGLIDEKTVLKYPTIAGDEEAHKFLGLEARIFLAIGPHKHIIGFKGQTDDGLLLEHAPFGSVYDYLRYNYPGLQQRFTWICQSTEALAVVHKKHVVHRDISASNLLLDAELNIKLSDFQGRLLTPDGKVQREGQSCEGAKASMPRANLDHCDWKTDIFALGSAFYYILHSHELYPDLHSAYDEEQIVERFTSGQFPEIECTAMRGVIQKCWKGQFDSVEDVLRDLEVAGVRRRSSWVYWRRFGLGRWYRS